MFSFNDENIRKIHNIFLQYPENRKRSALLPILHITQDQNGGYLSKESMEYIAKFLDLSYLAIYEVVSFYDMFNLAPVGKYHIKVCTTLPCCIMGGEEILKHLKQELNIDLNNTTEDKLFTLKEVECLGCCVWAPLIQINDQNYEKLTVNSLNEIIEKLKSS
jgi:NADH-quinone oxidoreductase subunit E